MFGFKRADITEIAIIQHIAELTWPITYEPMLGKEQVAYMLQTLYSHNVLQQQFEEGQLFYFIYQDQEVIGFSSFSELGKHSWKLHKIYILPQYQGTGAGKALLQFIIKKVVSLKANQLLLNVNRQNKARFFYEKNGFVVTKEEDINIGNGFFMNDYVMTLYLDEYIKDELLY